MNVTRRTKRKTLTETITHKTDLRFSIVETVVNGKLQDTKLTCRERELQPILLDLPEDWVNQFDAYSWLHDYEVKIKDIDSIDENKIYFINESHGIIFDKNKRIISLPYFFDYCDSLSENYPKDPIYAKLIALLRKHKYILKMEEETIPSYNADFSDQKGIKRAKAYLPQKKFESLYKKCKGTSYWSCEMHRYVSMGLHDRVGIYGKRIDKLLNEYWAERSKKVYDMEDN